MSENGRSSSRFCGGEFHTASPPQLLSSSQKLFLLCRLLDQRGHQCCSTASLLVLKEPFRVKSALILSTSLKVAPNSFKWPAFHITGNVQKFTSMGKISYGTSRVTPSTSNASLAEDIHLLISPGTSMVKRLVLYFLYWDHMNVCGFPLQAQLFNLEPEHFLPVVVNETEFSDWDNWRPETTSRLRLVIDGHVMTSGNLKIKCVVSSFQLYHQSNEVSIETFGVKPTPKSVVQRQTPASEVNLESSASASSKLQGVFILALILNCLPKYL